MQHLKFSAIKATKSMKAYSLCPDTDSKRRMSLFVHLCPRNTHKCFPQAKLAALELCRFSNLTAQPSAQDLKSAYGSQDTAHLNSLQNQSSPLAVNLKIKARDSKNKHKQEAAR